MNDISYSLPSFNTETQFNSRAKLFTFACVGHCLELYDHTLYAVMLPFLALYFFPGSHTTQLLFAFLSFAFVLIIAPIGSLFWGWYSDKYGRLAMLRATMLIMALPALGIALLPTYDAVGLFAPFLLILLRMMQSISASGEIMGAKIFIMESLSQKEHGFASGVITAVGGLGVLLAMGMGYLCSRYQTIEYFWRIPFLMGSILFIVGQLIRKRLKDNFLLMKKAADFNKEAPRLKQTFLILKNHPASSAIVLVLGAILGIMSYTMHAFINPYLIQQSISQATVYQYSILGLICTMVTALWAGYAVDKYKQVYRDLVKNIRLYALMSIPLFILIQQGGWKTMLAYMGFSGFLGAYSCLSGIIMYTVFPPEIRGRGVLFNYALGCATFGALTPLTLNYTSTFHPYLPGGAIAFCAIVCLIVLQKAVTHLKTL